MDNKIVFRPELFEGNNGIDNKVVLDNSITYNLGFVALRLCPSSTSHNFSLVSVTGSIVFFIEDLINGPLFLLVPKNIPRLKVDPLSSSFLNRLFHYGGVDGVDPDRYFEEQFTFSFERNIFESVPFRSFQKFLVEKGVFVPNSILKDLWTPLETVLRKQLDAFVEYMDDVDVD